MPRVKHPRGYSGAAQAHGICEFASMNTARNMTFDADAANVLRSTFLPWAVSWAQIQPTSIKDQVIGHCLFQLSHVQDYPSYQLFQQNEEMKQVVREMQLRSIDYGKRRSRRFHRFAALSFLLVFVHYWQFPSCRAGLVSRQDNSSTADNPAPFDWTAIHPSKELNWTDCYGRFQCARLTVPMLYSEPSGEEGAIAVIKYPSTYPPGHEKYLGPLLFNPGGPGGSGVADLLVAGDYYRTIVSDRFDLVGFDPRGVGFTTPALSIFDEQYEATKFFAEFPLNFNTSISDLGRAYAVSGILGDIAANRARFVAERISTPLVARDMLSIVKAFGQDKLQYWGFSYGTALGATFASMFPAHVGRVILDGVLDTNDYYSGAWMTNLRDADAALRDFYRSCVSAGPSKCAIYENSTALVETRVNRLLDRLKEEPLGFYNSSSPDGDYEVVDYPSVKVSIYGTLYFPHTYGPTLANAIAALEQGDASAFHAFSALAAPNSLPQLKCPAPGETPAQYQAGQEATIAIRCSDIVESRPESFESVRKAYQELAELSSFADMFSARISCSNWKVSTKDKFNGSFPQTTSYPLLLIGNTADPVTPLWGAQNVSRNFKDSVVLTQNSSGHCSFSAVSACTSKVVREYFINGTLPEEGTVCETESSIFGEEVNLEELSVEKRELMDATQKIHKNFVVPTLGGGHSFLKHFF